MSLPTTTQPVNAVPAVSPNAVTTTVASWDLAGEVAGPFCDVRRFFRILPTFTKSEMVAKMAATAYLWVENVPTSEIEFSINGGNIVGETRYPRRFPSAKYSISITPLDVPTLGRYVRAYKAHNLALAGKLEDLKPGFTVNESGIGYTQDRIELRSKTFCFKGAENRLSGESLTNVEDEHPVISTVLNQGDGSRFRRRPWPKAFVRIPSGGVLPVSFHSLGVLPDTAILTCGFALEGYLMSGDSKAGLEWVTEIVIIEGLLEEKVSVGTGPKTPRKRKADVDMDVLLGLSSGKKGELDMLPGGSAGEADSTYDVAAAVAIGSAPNTPTKSSAVAVVTAPVAGPSNNQPLFVNVEAEVAYETEGEGEEEQEEQEQVVVGKGKAKAKPSRHGRK